MAPIPAPRAPHQRPGVVRRVGVDLVHVGEVRAALKEYGERYLARCFTAGEIAECVRPGGISAEGLAARFAAKEAALKALEPIEGDGPVPDFRAIEVRSGRSGAWAVLLGGAAATLAARRGVEELSCSVAGAGDYAAAIVFAGMGEPVAQPGKERVGVTPARTNRAGGEPLVRAPASEPLDSQRAAGSEERTDARKGSSQYG